MRQRLKENHRTAAMYGSWGAIKNVIQSHRDEIMMTSSNETCSALRAFCMGNSPVTGRKTHKGQWRGALMFSFICAWTNSWADNGDAGDLRCYRAHYDVTVTIHSCVFSLVVGSIQNPCVRLFQNGGHDDRRTGLWRHVPFWWPGWGGCVREYVLSYLHHVPLYGHYGDHEPPGKHPQIARFMGPTWGPSGADRTQVGSMLAPWTLLSGSLYMIMALFSHSGA